METKKETLETRWLAANMRAIAYNNPLISWTDYLASANTTES